jgi:dTDP-4-amino-4,6-dideoxygalactose transaminase
LQRLADRHGLKVLYDAAHAFDITVGGTSILRAGNLSVLSFHATKVFNTFEGGAIVSHDVSTKARIDRLRNFGIADEVTVDEVGLNGKMSEVHAAFGLLQLRYIDAAIARRTAIAEQYRSALAEIPGIEWLPAGRQDAPNHSYFPVRVHAPYPLSRDALYEALRREDVRARRYFYPLISDLGAYRAYAPEAADALVVATAAAREILCLPIHPGLTDADVEAVIAVLKYGASGLDQQRSLRA